VNWNAAGLWTSLGQLALTESRFTFVNLPAAPNRAVLVRCAGGLLAHFLAMEGATPRDAALCSLVELRRRFPADRRFTCVVAPATARIYVGLCAFSRTAPCPCCRPSPRA
jgi:hypothetical protein